MQTEYYSRTDYKTKSKFGEHIKCELQSKYGKKPTSIEQNIKISQLKNSPQPFIKKYYIGNKINNNQQNIIIIYCKYYFIIMKEKNAAKKTSEKIERILGGNWLVFISIYLIKILIFF